MNTIVRELYEVVFMDAGTSQHDGLMHASPLATPAA
jgi:hypothetical protein